MCQKKIYFEEKHVDLLLIQEEGKRHYVLIKHFNTFMDITLHRGRKTFGRFCLQFLITNKILTCHVKKCFKISS